MLGNDNIPATPAEVQAAVNYMHPPPHNAIAAVVQPIAPPSYPQPPVVHQQPQAPQQQAANVHRCELGVQLCPRPDSNTKKSVNIEVGNKTVLICKFQHLKSPSNVAVLQARLETLVPGVRTAPYECFGCRTSSINVVTAFCKNRIAQHDFCSVKCALFSLSLYRQADWERAVDKNERMPPSST
jgi:hypothetical protein